MFDDFDMNPNDMENCPPGSPCAEAHRLKNTLDQTPQAFKAFQTKFKNDLYKKVRDHIKKTGFIINPLLVVEAGDKYKVVYGNNRYLAGVELNLKEFPIKILPNEEVSTIREGAKTYIEVKLDEEKNGL